MAKKPTNERQNETSRLFDAVFRGAIDELRELLSKGISPDAKDDKGTPLLVKAAQTKRKEIVEILLDHRADINAADNDGNTGLHIATNNEDFPMAQVFKSRGADENIGNKDGVTALQTALDFDLHAFSALFAAHSGTSKVPADTERPVESVDVGLATGDSDLPDHVEDDGSEDESCMELESAEVREFDGGGESSEQEAIPVTTIVTATAAAQTVGETPSLLDSLDDTFKDLVESSPDFFGKPRAMSLDELAHLVEDVEQESDDKQKVVSKKVSIQFALQPGLAKEMKDRKDFRHAGTIRKMKQGGDADLKLGKRGINTDPLPPSVLQELAKCPTDKIMVDIAKEAIAKKLSVRDIRKLVAPFVRKAKMEASGALTDLSPQCGEIIEALEDPEKLMQQPKLLNLLRDSDRLKDEFTSPELSRIHEKAIAAEAKIQKQKRALEEKGEGYVPVINFLRLIRKTISAVWGAAKS